MKLRGRVAIVTGGANGIGRALCDRFRAEGARAVISADLDADDPVDVRDAAAIERLVEHTIARYGGVDLFCSNAGIMVSGGVEAAPDEWQRIWEINVMAHVHAARAVLPHMLARGEGYLLQTASAAGLLSQIGSAPYAVTKHAAVGFAEWLAITYGDRGIRVSCLCPQGVRTGMLRDTAGGFADLLRESALEPAEVAEAVVRGIEQETFLILPHPEVAEYFRRKASDYDRWLRGMRRLQARV